MRDQLTTLEVGQRGKSTNVTRLADRLVGRVRRVEGFRSGPAVRLQARIKTYNGMAERLRLREKRRGLSPIERDAMERCHVQAARYEDSLHALGRVEQAEFSALRDDAGAVVKATRVASFLAERAISTDSAGLWLGGRA